MVKWRLLLEIMRNKLYTGLEWAMVGKKKMHDTTAQVFDIGVGYLSHEKSLYTKIKFM